jgi:hypothetical protein
MKVLNSIFLSSLLRIFPSNGYCTFLLCLVELKPPFPGVLSLIINVYPPLCVVDDPFLDD